MAGVVFWASFEMWLACVDRGLTENTGRGVDDIPVPERTWHIWYDAGYTAQVVALALIEPTARYLPPVTRSRGAWDDRPWQDVYGIWRRREAAATQAS